MNTLEITQRMAKARKERPDLFKTKVISINDLFGEKRYKVLGRYKNVNVKGNGTGILCFADQSPLGKSKWAREVKNGKKLSNDVQWLFVILNNQRIWLSRVVKGHITVLNKSWLYKNNLTIGGKV